MVFMERLSVAVLLAACILVHLSVGAPAPHHLNGAPHASEQAAQLSSLSTSHPQEAVIRLMIRKRDPHADNGISAKEANYNDITHASNNQVGNKAVIGQPNIEERSAQDLAQLSARMSSPLQTRTSHLDDYNNVGGLATDQPDPEHILVTDNMLSTENKFSDKHEPSKLITSWSTGNKLNLNGDTKTAESVSDNLTARINNAPLSLAQNAQNH